MPAEASNEYRNITVMTTLLPHPTPVQFISGGQYQQRAASHDDVLTSAQDKQHRQEALQCLETKQHVADYLQSFLTIKSELLSLLTVSK